MQHQNQSRKFCQRGSNFDNVFFFYHYYKYLVDEGREDPNIECLVALKFKGIRTSIAGKPYLFLRFFRGGGGRPDPLTPPLLWIRVCYLVDLTFLIIRKRRALRYFDLALNMLKYYSKCLYTVISLMRLQSFNMSMKFKTTTKHNKK